MTAAIGDAATTAALVRQRMSRHPSYSRPDRATVTALPTVIMREYLRRAGGTARIASQRSLHDFLR